VNEVKRNEQLNEVNQMNDVKRNERK